MPVVFKMLSDQFYLYYHCQELRMIILIHLTSTVKSSCRCFLMIESQWEFCDSHLTLFSHSEGARLPPLQDDSWSAHMCMSVYFN